MGCIPTKENLHKVVLPTYHDQKITLQEFIPSPPIPSNRSSLVIIDVIEPTTHLFQCINGDYTAAIEIYYTRDINFSTLHNYHTLSENYKKAFIDFHIFEDPQFTYIYYSNICTNIDTLLYNKQSFTESTLMQITQMLLECATMLHKNGIMHKRIATDNIFLTISGQYKLGIADIHKYKNKCACLLNYKHINYLYPDSIKENVEPRDMFSIGMVLLRIILGPAYVPVNFSDHFASPYTPPIQYYALQGNINEKLYDFIGNLICCSSSITAATALSHSWLSNIIEAYSIFPIQNSIFTPIKNSYNYLIQETVSMIMKNESLIDKLFNGSWNADNDIFNMLQETYSPEIEDTEHIKYAVLDCIRLFKEESLYISYCNTNKEILEHPYQPIVCKKGKELPILFEEYIVNIKNTLIKR